MDNVLSETDINIKKYTHIWSSYDQDFREATKYLGLNDSLIEYKIIIKHLTASSQKYQQPVKTNWCLVLVWTV